MKWLVFVMAVLATCMFAKDLYAKSPRNLALSDSDVAQIRTALGYTTMLGFESRPSSVILGDQDAFKVEYAGNGLAIKPLVPHAKTNLFVLTDYERYNFSLVTTPPGEADYVIRVKAKWAEGYPIETASKENLAPPKGDALVTRPVDVMKSCSGFRVTVNSVGWPRSENTLMVNFTISAERRTSLSADRPFEPGDFDLSQYGRSIPIENLYLQRLSFSKTDRSVQGTIIVRQSNLQKGKALSLAFTPDFLKQHCLKISFFRRPPTSAPKKS